MKFLLVACILLSAVTQPPQQPQLKESYVMFIPHTHDDPGWLMSFEGYYANYVKSILDNIVTYLDKNVDFKFVWCESSFLHRWWKDGPVELREKFKQLVTQKRIEIVGGGWVMHDEATPDFRDMIEQMDIGLTFINETLGVQPNTVWQIDPFGHGSTTAALAIKLGFTSIMLNRISTAEKQKLWNHNCDFYWEGNPTGRMKDDAKYIFTHVLHDHYSQSEVFRGDYYCFADYQGCVRKLFDGFISNTIGHTLTPVVPLLFGDDFTYNRYDVFEKAHNAIKYMSSSTYPQQRGYNLTTKLATYSEYINQVSEYHRSYGVYRGDFFPYAQSQGYTYDYWTGYFTTRPHLKQQVMYMMRQVRVANFLLLSAYILNLRKPTHDFSLAEIQENLISASRNSSILLHHDAITGTHAAQTYTDYMNIIKKSIEPLTNITIKLAKYLFNSSEYIASPIPIDNRNGSKEYIVYNSAAIFRKELININVSSKYVIVKRYDNAIISNCQVNQHDSEINLICEIGIDAYTMETVYVEQYESEASCKGECVSIAETTDYQNINEDTKIIIENDMYTVSIHPFTHFIDWIYDKQQHKIVSISEILIVFSGSQTRSGPYIFNPSVNSTYRPSAVNAQLANGELGWFLNISITYSRSDKFIMSFILLKGNSKLMYANYDYIDNTDGEILLQMDINGINASTTSIYASDSMNYIKRVYRTLNESATKNYAQSTMNKNEYIGYNTHPSVDGFVLRDNDNKTDYFISFSHSHVVGLSLLNYTSIGILLTRSTMHDDNKGVNDRVSDPMPSCFHTLLFCATSLDEFMELKSVSYQSIHNPFEIFQIEAPFTTKLGFLTNEFPPEVEFISSKILSITNKSLEVLVRIRNSYSHSVKLKVDKMFSNINSTYIGKMSLTGYMTEDELLLHSKMLKEKISVDQNNKVLTNLRDDFILLEESANGIAEELVPDKGEIVLSGFELIGLKFLLE